METFERLIMASHDVFYMAGFCITTGAFLIGFAIGLMMGLNRKPK